VAPGDLQRVSAPLLPRHGAGAGPLIRSRGAVARPGPACALVRRFTVNPLGKALKLL